MKKMLLLLLVVQSFSLFAQIGFMDTDMRFYRKANIHVNEYYILWFEKDSEGNLSGSLHHEWTEFSQELGSEIKAGDDIIVFDVTNYKDFGNVYTITFSNDSIIYVAWDHEMEKIWLEVWTLKNGELEYTDEVYLGESQIEVSSADMFGFVPESSVLQGVPLEESIEIDWKSILGEDDVRGEFLNYSASLESVALVEATESFIDDEDYAYSADLVFDNHPGTAWIPDSESVDGYPAGAFIELKGSVPNNKLYILNGLQYDIESFWANSRVRIFELFIDGNYIGTIELQDVMGAQVVEITELEAYKDGVVDTEVTIRLVISEVYPGNDYKDVSISEIYAR